MTDFATIQLCLSAVKQFCVILTSSSSSLARFLLGIVEVEAPVSCSVSDSVESLCLLCLLWRDLLGLGLILELKTSPLPSACPWDLVKGVVDLSLWPGLSPPH